MTTARRGNDRRHHIALIAVAAVVSAVLAYVFLRFDFIPQPFSRERTYIDTLLRVMFAIASVFFGTIMTVFCYSLVFFRRRRGEAGFGAPITGSRWLERAWTVIPLAIVISLSIYGGIVLARMDQPGNPPQGDLQVNVLAFRFGWQFTYPQYGDIASFELEMPVNRRVHFEIQSKDVVHSFWVAALGPKQDAVPGMTTDLYITPTRVGSYQVQCSQLCGSGHSLMVASAVVVSPSDFQKWINQQQTTATPTPTATSTPAPTTTFQALAAAGQTVYSANCAVCHGDNGQGNVGPALWGPGATLGQYAGLTLFANNAQAMLGFISARMPLSAPGSLTHPQYVDVLSYILVQDKQVTLATAFSESQLGAITLK